MIKELVQKNRSYRRFYEEKRISMDTLKELISIARLTPSASNKQPLRYMLFNEEDTCAKVFDTLKWAGYLKDWSGPEVGERPAAYIVIISPDGVNSAQDEGIAAQTILLSAVDMGMGGCMLGAVNRPKLAEEVQVPLGYQIKLVIALGYPKEQVVIDEIHADENVKYYRDDSQVHHVPKICLEDLIITE